jgi:MFS family permease
MKVEALSSGQRQLSLLALNLCVLGAGTGLGAVMPLMALRLAARGASATVIGLNSAMPPLAILLVGPFIPALLTRLGSRLALVLGLLLAALGMVLMPVLPSIGAWFVLRFFCGAATSIPWVVSETWLNIIATDGNRGRIIGIYGAVLAAGIALGPLIVGAVGSRGALPFLLVAAILVLAALPVVLAGGLVPRLPLLRQGSLGAVYRTQPLALACGLGGGLMDFALFSFLPIYALGHGHGEGSALLVLSLFMGGNALLQIPIGWIADRTGWRRSLFAASLVTLLGALLLPFAIGAGGWLYVLLIVWGGTTFAIYTLGLGLLGDRFPPGQMANASVALIMAYDIGSILGPTLSGTAIDLVGPEGLVAVIAIAAAALLLLWVRLGASERLG